MRLYEPMSKLSQGFVLVLAGLIICGLLMAASICLAAGAKWTKKANMPTPRYVATSAVNGRIYAIGGGDLAGTVLSTVEEYTPEGRLSAVSLQGKLEAMWGKIKKGGL